MNKKAMYSLSYGLFVLTARVGDKDNGCIINTAGQVTSEPNRISIAVNKANLTHDMVMESGKFNISILSEKASFDIFKHFGFQTGKVCRKFFALIDIAAHCTAPSRLARRGFFFRVRLDGRLIVGVGG